MLVTIGIKHYKEREFLQNTEIFQQLISGDLAFGSFFSDLSLRGSGCVADCWNGVSRRLKKCW